jgi:hypothetical protein
MVDTAARPSDLHRLFRTTTGRNSQIRFENTNMFIRYFWSKEVDPGSSRANSTNIFFSKWVKVCGTMPKLMDTVETMKAFLQRNSDPALYATVYIPELNLSAQPLIYAKLQDLCLPLPFSKHNLSCLCLVYCALSRNSCAPTWTLDVRQGKEEIKGRASATRDISCSKVQTGGRSGQRARKQD